MDNTKYKFYSIQFYPTHQMCEGSAKSDHALVDTKDNHETEFPAFDTSNYKIFLPISLAKGRILGSLMEYTQAGIFRFARRDFHKHY